MKKKNINDYIAHTGLIFNVVFGSLILWVLISNTVQRFKCPTMTETELLLHIPKSFVCNWSECK